MADLENLTKTLIQIVGSLQQILAKKGTGQSTIEPQQPKLKKTPEMTYNEFIQKALATRKPVEVTSKKMSFKLQQDLQLLSQISNYNQISIKTFEEIAKSKKLNRTTESLKARYHDYLYQIDEKQMKKIVAWIQKQGLQGYLYWQDDEMKIQLKDSYEKKQEKKRQRTSALESQAKKYDKTFKKSKTLPVNCKQLSDVLRLYSKMVNIPVKYLIQKLDQLSGNLVDLDNYIETKDARMLWTQEEDQLLKRGGPQLDMLKRYRGAENVEKRRKYLDI